MNLQPAYIGLGANLGRPVEQIRTAFEELAMLPQTRLARVSSLYRSAPMGYKEQPDFINAVAQIETALTPRVLLGELLAIERQHGRRRDFPNAPRTLDLDIVLYDEVVLREPGLTIPHPRMHERAFVMLPLAEIAPDAMVPGHGLARELAAALDAGDMTRIEATDE